MASGRHVVAVTLEALCWSPILFLPKHHFHWAAACAARFRTLDFWALSPNDMLPAFAFSPMRARGHRAVVARQALSGILDGKEET